MALLERAQIELNDITDSAPAIFTLSASQPKVQIEKDGNYSPNYTPENPQVITPTLYIGNTDATSSITDISYSGYEGESEEWGINFKINTNLTNSVVITATITNFEYNNINYGTLTAQIELTKLSSTSNQYTAFISSDRSIFTPDNRNDITLTASLYLGASQVNNVGYQWYQNGAKLNGETESTCNVTVAAINSMSNYYCIITVGSNSYPTSSITIMDKTDPYSSQIISSDGLIFTSDTNTTTLTCNVYQSNQLIEEPNSIIYNWYKNSISDNQIGAGKQIGVTPQEENTSSVTYYCVASINGTETTSQITLAISPAFEAVVEPKQIFIPFTGDKYEGGDSYELTFYLQFSNNSIVKADIDSVKVSLNSEIEQYFSYNSGPISPDSNNKYTITFKINTDDFSQFPDSAICSINYTYRGVNQQQEFYFVKNVKGANGEDGKDGENGKDGNGIDHIDISYARSNDGVRPPNDNEEGGKINWYPSIEEIPEKDLVLQFLWEKRIIYSTELENNTNKILSKEYSVQKDGLEIEKIVEYYALGIYASKTGVYVKEVKYNESGIRDSVILEDGQEKFIFDENGELLLNENGDIIDMDKNVIFSSSEFELASFARLYEEEVEWTDTVLISSQNIEPTTQSFLEELVNIRPGLIFLSVTEPKIEPSKNSLWIKYQMIYTNNTFGETEPMPLEEMNQLRLTAYNAETIYNNNSIQHIVQQTDWKYTENGKVYTDFISYIEQMPKEIAMRVSNEEFSTYFTLKDEGVRIGKTNSNFTTLTTNKGFNIQHHPSGYNSETTETPTTVGTFDARGLNTPEIALATNLEENTLKTIIILKGTSSGGMLWIKGKRGGA